MRTKLQKWGNSLGLRIPKSLADDLQVGAGSIVDLGIEDGDLVIRPRRRPEYTLEELLENVRAGNVHREVETGSPEGREAW